MRNLLATRCVCGLYMYATDCIVAACGVAMIVTYIIHAVTNCTACVQVAVTAQVMFLPPDSHSIRHHAQSR